VNIKLRSTYQLEAKIMQEIFSRVNSTDMIGIKEQICFKTLKRPIKANFGLGLKGENVPVMVLNVCGGVN
jgi:hypothetical protein